MAKNLSIMHLSIDYDEGVKDSYRGVVLKEDGREEKRFFSEDPVADWANYLKYAIAEGISVLESSSITHFVFDNPEWRFSLDGNANEILVTEDRPEWLEEMASGPET